MTYLLTDKAEKEQCLIPAQINDFSKATLQEALQAAQHDPSAQAALRTGQSDPVVQLCDVMFRLADYESQRLIASPAGHGLSPLLSQQILMFFDRWAQTYLYAAHPDLHHPPSPTILRCFDHAGDASAARADASLTYQGAHHVLSFVIDKGTLALALWTGEDGVVQAAVSLLGAIMTNPRAAAAAGSCESWKVLHAAQLHCIAGTLTQPLAESGTGSVVHHIVTLPSSAQGAITKCMLEASICSPGDQGVEDFRKVGYQFSPCMLRSRTA